MAAQKTPLASFENDRENMAAAIALMQQVLTRIKQLVSPNAQVSIEEALACYKRVQNDVLKAEHVDPELLWKYEKLARQAVAALYRGLKG